MATLYDLLANTIGGPGQARRRREEEQRQRQKKAVASLLQNPNVGGTPYPVKSGGLLSPEQFQYVDQLAKFGDPGQAMSLLGGAVFKGGDAFTLSPGQARYDASGQQVASLLDAPKTSPKYGDFSQVPGAPEGTYGQRNLNTNEWGNIKTPNNFDTGSNSGLKASDENSIFSFTAAQFEGMYDPVSGQFKGLKGEDKQSAQSIATEAVRLVKTQGLSRLEAVTQAARKFGIQIRDLSGSMLGTQTDSPNNQSAFNQVPPAGSHKGRYIRDSQTNQRFYSDGKSWHKVE